MMEMATTPGTNLIGEESALQARAFDVVALAQQIGQKAAERAVSLDMDGSFPAEDVAALAASGLLSAPFPRLMGGDGLGINDPDRLLNVLTEIGRGSLALGRLYEGHVNAVVLARRYGDTGNLVLMRSEADSGRLSGVWMAGPTLKLETDRANGWTLRGHKVLCSGAGYIRRPLVAAEKDGNSLMLLPELCSSHPVDTTSWTAHGMRATATGTVSFDGISIAEHEIVGKPGDYLRAPYFRGGAWRVIAVQLGGLTAIMNAYRQQLACSPHACHPLQLGRLGEAEISFETARLWVRQAGEVAETRSENAGAIDAYVDLARSAFERAALNVIGCAQKAIGLNAYLRPNPLERLIRDLATYLRQPALDVSLMSAAAFELGQTHRQNS